MDRAILGDNQFFGVNHMSEAKGMHTMQRFQDNSAIVDVLDTAYDCGIRAFSFSTHDRVAELCDHFRGHPSRYRDLRLYPTLPYAQKYAHAVTEKGIIGAVSDVILSDNTAVQAAGLIARGSTLLFNRNAVEMMRLLVDVEMKMFRGLELRVVFLQNILTDLLLGLGWTEMFYEFAAHVKRTYGVPAGFITLNMPRLVDTLLDVGTQDPVVCAAINQIGFQMSPNVSSYERCLAERPFQPLAMSVLAAGALHPRQALSYIGSLNSIKGILFGASSRSHIEEMKGLVEEHLQ